MKVDSKKMAILPESGASKAYSRWYRSRYQTTPGRAGSSTLDEADESHENQNALDEPAAS
ncbi:MAG: hypothetical protein ABS69_13170 [Nitrosomonadales bacterium SCN 54-20]|nr:MAG: hypothetical protein ABS69_13170 [Nitrosomonadales bacterium SCN 54-20]